MKKPLLTIAFLLIVILAIWLGGPGRDLLTGTKHTDKPAATTQGPAEPSDATEDRPSKTDTRPAKPAERAAIAGIKKLSGAEHSVEEELKDKVSITARARVRLGKGQSMLTGGHLDEGGRRVFSVMVPKRVDSTTEPGTTQIMMGCTIVALDPMQMRETGLDRLVTDRKANEKEAGIWSVDDAQATLALLPPESYRSRPTLLLAPGHTGSVETEWQGIAERLEITATPTEEGGFDLDTGWRHAVK
ncbi:hypothetical protein [Luteolibacter sp. Populi]|uniref:hypothetical protein n=1 Tax=Luteolibacter sp. Populi TaxID=3230487 RepID=UPI0034663F02